MFDQENVMAESTAKAAKCKAWVAKMQAGVREKEEEIRSKETQTREAISAIKEEYSNHMKAAEDKWKSDERNMKEQFTTEYDRLRTANASVLKQIEDQVRAAEVSAKERLAALGKSTVDALNKEKKETSGRGRKTGSDAADT